MAESADVRLDHRARHRLAPVLLASLILCLSLAAVAGYSNTTLEPAQAGTRFFTAQPASSRLAPFLDIVPSQDGTELFIQAGGVGELEGTVYANVSGIGPTSNKGGWTMTYSETMQVYVTTVPGFSPAMDDDGSVGITTTLGLDTGVVDFNRAYVPATTITTIHSSDGNVQLALVSPDTFPSEAYVAVVPSFAPPGPAPLGHRFVGSAYSVRASGAIVLADRPMSLRMGYSATTFAGADPHTLAIFAWDAAAKRWDELGGRLFYDQQYVSVATRRFTTYALMVTPAWRDAFDDFSGLDFAEVNNVTLGGPLEDRMLVLISTPGNGVAVSKPITPTTAIDHWGSLTFTGNTDPPTTTLTVDVLSVDGTELLTDVTSGASLAGLDPAQNPSLRLRANLSSAVAEETPALDEWRLTWQVEQDNVYLPVVLRSHHARDE